MSPPRDETGGGTTGFSTAQDGGAVNSCQNQVVDPRVTESLKVFDPETPARRPYDPKSCAIDIVQTEATDTLVIEYDGPEIPAKLDVYLHGEKIGEAKGGGRYSYELTYAPKVSPYFRSGSLLDAVSTYGHAVCAYEFRGIPGKTITARVHNPDQWKLAVQLPPMRGYSIGAKLEDQKASAQFSAARRERREERRLTAGGGDGVAAMVERSGSSSASVSATARASFKYDVSTAGWGRKTTST